MKSRLMQIKMNKIRRLRITLTRLSKLISITRQRAIANQTESEE